MDNEEARMALIAAMRHLQEAVLAIVLAQERAPEIREDLQYQIDNLVPIFEAISLHPYPDQRPANLLPHIPDAGA